MGPQEESSQSETPQPEVSGARPAPRRGRRSGRGRRGHGRRGPKPTADEPPPISQAGSAVSAEEPEPIFELAEEQAETSEMAPPADMVSEEPLESPPVSTPGPVIEKRVESSRATEPSVQSAIEEVSGIVDALRVALDDMEEVLEMLEIFERQQNLDEREIESLRRALRQVNRPRDGGHPRR